MKRHVRSTFSAGNSEHFIGDKLDLILPRHDFIIGGTIPFELKFTTTSKDWDIELRMNKIYAKSKNPKSKKSNNFKFFTKLYDLKQSVYKTSSMGGSFYGILEIPEKIPPTIRSFNKPTIFAGELIHEIEYILEVRLCTEEWRTPPVVEIPIELGYSRNPKTDLQPISENLQEMSTKMDEINSLLSTRLEGLSISEVSLVSGTSIQDQPPRYSRLSLPIAGCSRSNSVETLPPYYEDILLRSNR